MKHLNLKPIADAITAARGGASKSADASYGPSLAKRVPVDGEAWNRPWGRVETRKVTTRKPGRRAKATMATESSARTIAILTTEALTPEMLASREWKLARDQRNGSILDRFFFPFAAVSLIGAVALGLIQIPVPTLPALIVVLCLGVVAGIVTIAGARKQATETIAAMDEAGQDWFEVTLGDGDALARLIWDLDALAWSFEDGKVADETWSTARRLALEVTMAAIRGALIDDSNFEFRQAQSYIAAARVAIAEHGRVDVLEAPQTA